jgi:hypothetical protein
VAKFTQVLVVVAAISLILAVVASWGPGTILNVRPEGFSRGCTNLLLLAIASVVVFPGAGKKS